MAKPTAPFRVHFEDGIKIDVVADSVDAANKSALQQHAGIIRKTKIIRMEAAHG